MSSTSDINKAYWIDVIKQHGSGGGINHLREITGQSHPGVKGPLDFLTLSGYIEMQVSPADKRTCTYIVTSLGHSYLNEHPDELAAYRSRKVRQDLPANTDSPAPAAVHHTVPGARPPMQRIPTFSRRPAVETAVSPLLNSPPQEAVAASLRLTAAQPSEPAPVTPDVPRHPEPTPKTAIVTPQTVANALAGTQMLVDQIKDAAAPLLFKVYAGEISLKQLVDFLNDGTTPE